MDVHTKEFEFSHGFKPRGDGQWAFLVKRWVGGERLEVGVFFTPGSMRLSDAKVWAKAHARETFPNCDELEVAP